MSYDLAVFDPSAAPTSRAEFVEWFKQQTEWSEPHDYNDPETPAAPLRAWFNDMIATYPPMNGPFASDDPDDASVTDYSLGRAVIYAAFEWSQAGQAHEHVRLLAAKHNLGFADVGSEGFQIWLPSGGELRAMK